MKTILKRLGGLCITVMLVIANAVIAESILDMYNITHHRVITGAGGTMFILLSLVYSLRKRYFPFGRIKGWLYAHEILSIIGVFLIFVHTGTHFRALVPVITFGFMFTTFISGLTGRYVYNSTKAELNLRRDEFKRQGLPEEEIDQRLWALTVASSTLSRWRSIHMPIVSLLGLMVLYHAISSLYYGGL
jgi:hypothetical protein